MLTPLKSMQELPKYLLVCLLASIPTAATAQGFQFNFAHPVVLAPTETPGAWYVDRYAPCGFVSPATAPDGTANTLEESICATNYQGPDSFYNTQGRDYDLPHNTTSLSIFLYVPAAWATENQRIAGFWGAAVDSSGIVTGSGDYPIIEFQGPITSDAGGPGYHGTNSGAGFYGWNNVTGAFGLIGLPTGFTYNTWVKLTITLIPGTGFEYTVSNASGQNSVSLASPFSDSGDLTLATVLLQGYNYDPSYNIFWNGVPGLGSLDTPFQVAYATNFSAGESYINIINDGANGAPALGPGFGTQEGNICVNLYAFDPAEEEVSCCSCMLTPNQVGSLDVNKDLLAKTQTGVSPSSVTVKLVATLAGANCTNSAAGEGTLVYGMVAYGTTPQRVATGVYHQVEHRLAPASLSADEYASITGRCASILGNASGYGQCTSCTPGALGASKQ